MSLTPKNHEHRKLINHLPPEKSWGRLLGVLATSYEMQPEFFETDFLPTLLGLGAWDDRNWTSRIAMEKYLAELEVAALLVDARPYRGRPRSLRVEVQPVCLAHGKILHAKVLIAVHEYAIRLSFGSANLTEPGYRRNREVAAVFTATPDRLDDSIVVRDALRGMISHLTPWLSEGAKKLANSTEILLSAWIGAGTAEKDQWFVWGGGIVPIWQQVMDRWPENDRIELVTLVSPFWSEEDGKGPIRELFTELRSRGCLASNVRVQLLTEGAPAGEGVWKPQLPESFTRFEGHTIGVEAVASPVDPRVDPAEIAMGEELTRLRSLHAKVALFEGQNTTLALLGSANFTRRGWGFLPNPQSANIEASLIIRRQGGQRTSLGYLIPTTTGEPVSLELIPATKIATPEPSPAEDPWPSFLRSAVLTAGDDQPQQLSLNLIIDPIELAGAWEVRHLETEGEPSPPILFEGQGTSAEMIAVPLSQQQLQRLIREQEISVSWWETTAARLFPVNVSASARTALPISPSAGRPAEQQLVAYYQGRISWEDLFPDPDEGSEGDRRTMERVDPVGVDTTRIQSYVVREFVEALTGINDDLRSAAQATRGCMRLALLGPVSPVALAHHVVESASNGERTATAAGFQLVEILGCLAKASGYFPNAQFASEWISLAQEAHDTVQLMLENLQLRFADHLSDDFARYAKSIRKHSQEGATAT